MNPVFVSKEVNGYWQLFFNQHIIAGNAKTAVSTFGYQVYLSL